MTRQSMIKDLLEGRALDPKSSASAAAPANIALIKYWGKRDPELNLPVTDSLSVSLGEFGTRTTLAPLDGERDEISLNGKTIPSDAGFARRLSEFLDLFRPQGMAFRVKTQNTIPTAAGLASSASGFAALVKALDALFNWELPIQHQSILARLGSGSACRSLFDGFAHWHAGTRDDGMDSFADPVPAVWPGLRVGVVTVDNAAKAVSSRDGMNRTTATSEFYKVWPRRVAADLAAIQPAIQAKDLPAVGAIAEANALAMHATMLAARPPLAYWRPGTLDAFERVRQLRRDGIAVYFTIDAGPNVKLLFESNDLDGVAARFPELEVAVPFGS